MGRGKGPIDAFVHSLSSLGIAGVSVLSFHEDALSSGSDALAVAYVQARGPGETKSWGVARTRASRRPACARSYPRSTGTWPRAAAEAYNRRDALPSRASRRSLRLSA